MEKEEGGKGELVGLETTAWWRGGENRGVESVRGRGGERGRDQVIGRRR